MRDGSRGPGRRRAPGIDPGDVWTPGDADQMDALVAACALVAQADGWVTPDERVRMLERIRCSAAIAVFGSDEVAFAFQGLVERFDRDLDGAEAAAEAAVARLRGRPGPSRLLIETACAIADADGGFDREERDVVLRLCRLLGLDPAEFDLLPVEGLAS